MPPRTRATAKEEKKAGAKSTAAAFRDEAAVKSLKPPTTAEIAASPDQAPEAADVEVEDEIAGKSIVFRTIYTIQDFLNDELDFAKFVQLVILAFIIHVFYINNRAYVLKNISKIGFNAAGVGMAFVFSYRSRQRLHQKNPTKFVLPPMPEFNLVYSTFIPTALAAVYQSELLHLNLCLNYFVVDYVHILIRLGSAIAYYQIYREEDDQTPTMTAVAAFAFHAAVHYALNYFNKGSTGAPETIPKEVLEQDDTPDLAQAKASSKTLGAGTRASLSEAEIQLFAVLLTNVVYYAGLNDQYNLPLIIFQKLVLSFVAAIALLYPLFAWYSSTRGVPAAIAATGVFGGLFVWLTNYQLTLVLGTSNAVHWLWNYIFESQERRAMMTTWMAALAVVIPVVFVAAPSFSLNLRRKVWHLLILGMVAYPAYVHQPQFTVIALLGSAVVFVVAEIVRFNRFTVIGQWLSQSLLRFQDFKDLKGPLNVSYIYLIAGVTLPMVFDYCVDRQVTIEAYLGLIALGLGDLAASIVGKRFGSVKWKGGPKSVQGTVAFVAITFAGLFLVDQFCLEAIVPDWEPVFVGCLIGGILEGVCTLNDNLVIPCMMMIALRALEKR